MGVWEYGSNEKINMHWALSFNLWAVGLKRINFAT